ncbi:MAG: hypothetical protein Q7J16_03020 [Candidatus Cloacimonadales bacterium]|nr:hypothetical protein [Candidatus Cloacimonadales bacterium]
MQIAHTVKNRFATVEVIRRQELYDLLQQEFFPDLKETTFRWRIYELKQSNIIVPIKRGIYKLSQAKKSYVPALSVSQRKINRLISKTFNDIQYCSWNSNWLNDFSRHQAFSNTLFLDVEKELIQSVYHLLIDNSFKNIYLAPDQNIIDTYISENKESIVIKPLISKSPIIKITRVPIPTLEKILVDLFFDDKLLNAYKGHEQITIFESAFDEYQIDISRLINYSRRRKRENQLKDFLIQNQILRREIFL